MPIVPNATTPALRAEIQPGIWLDSRRALWLAQERILAVADLHWGYAASHRARGNLLPVWGDDEIEESLQKLVSDYAPAEMIWLGDVVHAAEGAARAERYLAGAGTKVTVLKGNHDRLWRHAAERTAQRGRYFFHHGDQAPQLPADCIEVLGHHHPAVVWSDGAGGVAKLPAAIAGPTRIILPAFSPWAAGTDCTSLMTHAATVWIISRRRIFARPPRDHASTTAL